MQAQSSQDQSSNQSSSFAQAGEVLLQSFANLFPAGSEAAQVWQSLLAQVWRSLLAAQGAEPSRLAALQADYLQQQLALWGTLRAREWNVPAVPVPSPGAATASATATASDQGDKRFAGRAWRESGYHDYLRQAYLLNSRFLSDLVESAQLDGQAKQRLRFYTRQLIDAMSPSNFAATNPEALQLALETKGESLHAGIRHLIEDLERGRVSMSDESAFEVGTNLAVTPGEVVFENALIQLIQYKPATAKVRKQPLLMVPPCINKFYILDLQPENSFVRYAVEQGNTVFMVSWRNITEDSLGGLTWDDYIAEGVLRAIEVVRSISKSDKINTLGFCVGGTLLAAALAVLRARGEECVASMTLLATMLDFTDPGDIGVFVDETSMAAREASIGRGGILSGKDLAFVFSALRANDLLWSYVVNNYLKGKTPDAFDILYWNADSTNLPGPMYCWYVRNMYLENKLREPGKLTMCGERVDLGAIRVPGYIVATREDHIVPWRTAYLSTRHLRDDPQGDWRGDTRGDKEHGSQGGRPGSKEHDSQGDRRDDRQSEMRADNGHGFQGDMRDDRQSEMRADNGHGFQGDMRFVLGASGHVAGVINPASKKRRSYWTSDNLSASAEEWLTGAKEVSGSWWPNWNAWLQGLSGGERAAPKKLGSAKFKPIEPAPGRYVKVRV